MQETGEDFLAINLDGAVWVPYKELFSLISTAIYAKNESRIQELESTLRTYKVDFLRLLKNPAKRSQSREAVKKAVTDGIRILGQQELRVLSQSVVNEAIILSDLFELNEIVALELLLAGESQQPRLSFLPRGLVAVLLYYDGRRCLVNSLRALIQARKGRCWTLDLAPEVTDLATKFTDDLWNEGLRDQLFNNLVSFNPAREHERLESSLALGDAKHRKQIMDLIVEIHVSLAECLYCWSCQTGLATADVLRLTALLAEVIPSRGDGALDGTQFTLIMALFHSLDCESLRASDDFHDNVESIPILADHDFVASVQRDLMSPTEWKCPPLKAVVQFAWSISLRNLAQLPIVHGVRQHLDEEEIVLDIALEGGALCFLRNAIVGNPRFFTEEFFIRRIHSMVTDFIVNFPLKIKELRNRGDELARVIAQGEWEIENLTPIFFKNLFELIAAIYCQDPFDSELTSEYWCPPDAPIGGHSSVYYPTMKQVNLFKFVRLSGDLLPPLLYVSYVDMLNGLSNSSSGARYCFNLLKANGFSGVSSIGGERHYHRSIVSWDHFFASVQRYFMSLRQEPTQTQRAMSPQELEGLCAFLQLTETIATNDDMSCHALTENTEWNSLPVFVGLLSCGVPIELKAQLTLTLAAFAKSTEASVILWHTLEAAQILPSSMTSEFHMRSELNEVESRNEAYPLTRAFVKLLITLVNSFSQIEVRQLSSRFDTCVLFVINDIFSKFYSRLYKSVEEKWKVACDCLEFLLKLMTTNEPGTSIVRTSLENRPVKPNGSDLVLFYMLQDTRLFRTVMYIIDESLKIIISYGSITDKETLERCALLSLRMVQTALERQDAFMAALRESNSDLAITGLDQLLVGINQQSGKADFPARITKFVIFNDSLPEHSFYAISILSLVLRSPSLQEQIVSAFLLNLEDAKELRQGFVECVEVDDNDSPGDTDLSFSIDENALTASRIRGCTRRSIIRLLTNGLHYPPPNLSLFFLGYDLYRPSLKTVLQDPGVLGSPYTCLHAVLEILFRGYEIGLPVTRELCQRLVFTACANPDTSSSTLRYLRSSHDFCFRQLRMIAQQLNKKTNEFSMLNSQTWLLKTVAIEIRVLSVSGQRSTLNRLTETLLSEGGRSSMINTTLNVEDGVFNLDAPSPSTVSSSPCLLLAFLDQLDLSQSFPTPPQWEFFDANVMEQVIVGCERLTADGYLAVDVHRLHRFLLTEVVNLQGAGTSGHRPLIAEEIKSVLQYVVNRNRVRHALHSKRLALDAWRLLTEAVLLSVSLDVVRNVPVILELVHTLLHKILSESSMLELSQRASGVLLTLIAALRHCFLSETMSVTSAVGIQLEQRPVPWASFASSLEAVLGGLLESIIQAGKGSSKLRAHYYSALFNFLRLTGEPSSSVTTVMNDSQRKFISRCVDIIQSYGDMFSEILCRDACNTNDVIKMLSLCCLSVLASNDSSRALIIFMATNGYLADYVDGLKNDDRQLQAILTSKSTDLRALYLYETKMAFLIHIASSVKGVQLLLSCNLLESLAEMKSLGMKPESLLNDDDDQALFTSRYFQILVPSLKLSLLLITSPISTALEAKSKAVNLLVCHADCFGALLRNASVDRSFSNKYSVVVSLIAHSISELDVAGASPDIQTELSHLFRFIQALLPALIEGRRSRTIAGRNPQSIESKDVEDLGWAKSIISLLSFCISLARSTNEGMPVLTFGSKLLSDDSAGGGLIGNLRSLPDLGLLFFLLKHCVEKVVAGMQVAQSSSSTDFADASMQSHSLFFCIIEHTLYLLYFHLDFYIVGSSSSSRLPASINVYETSAPRISRLRRLHDMSHNLNQAVPPLNRMVTDNQQDYQFPLTLVEAAALQNDCERLLTEALLANVLQVSEYRTSANKGRFMVAMVRRLRWIMSLRIT